MIRPFPALLLLALVQQGLYAAFTGLGDLRPAMVEAILLYLLLSAFYILACVLVLNLSLNKAKRHSSSSLLWLIAGAGILFRLTVFPSFPALSDDIFRYRWEGMAQAHGANPYQVRPADSEWAHLRDETYDRIPGQEFKAVYGPAVQLAQRFTYAVAARASADPAAQIYFFKLVYGLFDAAILLLFPAFLRARHLPPEWAVVYSWAPLSIIEFWGSGHNDSLLLLALVLAFWAAGKNRWSLAFVALSVAAAAKLWPVLLWPAFLAAKPFRGPWKAALWSFPVPLLLCLPYWSSPVENIQFASGFLGGWRNNDSLFGLILLLAGDPYRAKFLSLAIIAAAALAVCFTRWQLESRGLAVTAALLLISANVHPWYLTWLVPLLPFAPVPALFLWTALAPLGYQAVIGWNLLRIWEGSQQDRWLIYGPVFAMFGISALLLRLGLSTPHTRHRTPPLP
jgi:alpha-1,6-mannosyltransferase